MQHIVAFFSFSVSLTVALCGLYVSPRLLGCQRYFIKYLMRTLDLWALHLDVSSVFECVVLFPTSPSCGGSGSGIMGRPLHSACNSQGQYLRACVVCTS